MKNTKQSKRKGDLLGKRSFHTTNKKAVSLMLSYVLLISIILVLSIGVYSWLKLVANVEPEVDCKDDTSIIIKDYSCDPTSTISNFDLTLKNNGRFSVEGVIVTVGNDSSKTPMTYLVPNKMGGLLRGHYYFLDLLKPGEEVTVNFFNNGVSYVTAVTPDPAGEQALTNAGKAGYAIRIFVNVLIAIMIGLFVWLNLRKRRK